MSAVLHVRGVGVWSGGDKPPASLLPARMRGRASPLTSLFAEVVEQATRAAGVDDMYSRLDLAPAIEQAIARLEPHYRDIVLLIDVDGLQYDEVAMLLDIPIGTVRSRLYRARRMLQEALVAYAIDAGFDGARPASAANSIPSSQKVQ